MERTVLSEIHLRTTVLGFITTVSLEANTHCMTDRLTLACLAPYVPEPSLAMHANINGLPDHAVVRHLLSLVQAGTNNSKPSIN